MKKYLLSSFLILVWVAMLVVPTLAADNAVKPGSGDVIGTFEDEDAIYTIEAKKAKKCIGQECGELTQCDPSGCYCFKVAERQGKKKDGYCVDDFSCGSAEPCTTSKDCSGKDVCYVGTCCGGNPGVCGPPKGQCTGTMEGVKVGGTASGQ